MKREYIDLPDPDNDPDGFNNYLISNNKVVNKLHDWIVIENKYIPKQLVIFCLQPKSYIYQLNEREWLALRSIMFIYASKHVYINSEKDKSIPNRLHLHVKL